VHLFLMQIISDGRIDTAAAYEVWHGKNHHNYLCEHLTQLRNGPI